MHEDSCGAGANGFDFMLASGEPINEPVVQHGPMVMNTKDEINQAFQDYKNGKNGFENAHSWMIRSKED